MRTHVQEHAEEWTAFEADCELLHYHSEEDHDHEGDATEEHAHAPGEEHDHGDDHEVIYLACTKSKRPCAKTSFSWQ